MKVSTRTASRSPEMSVDDVGDHLGSVTPGPKSALTTGGPALTKTSHRNGLLIKFAPYIETVITTSALCKIVTQTWAKPPSTNDSLPVSLLSSDARKTMALATSGAYSMRTRALT